MRRLPRRYKSVAYAGSSCATTTSQPYEFGLPPIGSGHIERPMLTRGIGSGIPIRGRMGSGDMYGELWGA